MQCSCDGHHLRHAKVFKVGAKTSVTGGSPRNEHRPFGGLESDFALLSTFAPCPSYSRGIATEFLKRLSALLPGPSHILVMSKHHASIVSPPLLLPRPVPSDARSSRARHHWCEIPYKLTVTHRHSVLEGPRCDAERRICEPVPAVEVGSPRGCALRASIVTGIHSLRQTDAFKSLARDGARAR
jgi:hypothetical protein